MAARGASKTVACAAGGAGIFLGVLAYNPDLLRQTSARGVSNQGARGRKISKSGFDITPYTINDHFAALATAAVNDPDVAFVASGGTEARFSGHWDKTDPGTYVSAVGHLPLFSSTAKFPSECGWPSFSQPIDEEHVEERTDMSHSMV